MSHRMFPLSRILGLGLSVAVLAGCAQEEGPQTGPAGANQSASPAGDSGDYNPHDVPITEEQKEQLRQETAQFAQAVAKIKQFRNETEQETKGGIPENPYKAHQALDQADLVLTWLPEIAGNSSIPKDRWEEATTTANDLRGLFEKVHQNIDNKQDPDFAAVAADIDQKIAVLEEIAQAQPAAAGESNPDNG